MWEGLPIMEACTKYHLQFVCDQVLWDKISITVWNMPLKLNIHSLTCITFQHCAIPRCRISFWFAYSEKIVKVDSCYHLRLMRSSDETRLKGTNILSWLWSTGVALKVFRLWSMGTFLLGRNVKFKSSVRTSILWIKY